MSRLDVLIGSFPTKIREKLSSKDTQQLCGKADQVSHTGSYYHYLGTRGAGDGVAVASMPGHAVGSLVPEGWYRLAFLAFLPASCLAVNSSV